MRNPGKKQCVSSIINYFVYFFSPFTDTASNKLQTSNIFTIAKRTVDGQDMLYQSMKLTNGIWVLAELKIQAGNPNYTVSTGSRQIPV